MIKRIGMFFLVALLGLAIAQERVATDLGLQEGKPYEGTELNFLICCTAAPHSRR